MNEAWQIALFTMLGGWAVAITGFYIKHVMATATG